MAVQTPLRVVSAGTVKRFVAPLHEICPKWKGYLVAEDPALVSEGVNDRQRTRPPATPR